MVSCILTVYLAVLGLGLRAADAAGVQGSTPQLRAANPDDLYRQRGNLPNAKAAADIWERRAASGKDFEASWKLARACYWLGTNVPEKERREWLDKGVAAAKQAAAIEPNKPEGHFWWAANLGEIAQSNNSDGKKYKDEVKDQLQIVIAMAPGWQSGSAESALGTWYVKVPSAWILGMGGDEKKGLAWLQKAVEYAPESIHVRYALAEALVDDGKKAEAIPLLEAVIAATPNPEWLPEDRQYKEKATALLAKLKRK